MRREKGSAGGRGLVHWSLVLVAAVRYPPHQVLRGAEGDLAGLEGV